VLIILVFLVLREAFWATVALFPALRVQ